MNGFLELCRWIGWKKIAWTILCMILAITIAVKAGQQAEPLLTATFWAWVTGWILWVLKKIKDFFTPEKRTSIGQSIRSFLKFAFWVALVSIVLATIMSTTATTQTQAEPWKDAMSTIGLSPDTPRPERGKLPGLLCPQFPASSKKEEYCRNAADDIANNDIAGFRQEYAKATNQASLEQVKASKEIMVIHPWAVELVVVLIVFFAIIGAFFGRSIDYVGKIAGTSLWALIAALIYAGVVALSPTDELVEAFTAGAIIRGVAVILTILGAGFTLFREGVHVQGKAGQFILKVFFTCIASALGLGIDSLLQTPLLTSLVVNGYGINLNDAYVAYQLGTIFAGGFVSMIGTGVLFFQCYVATPKGDRS